MLDFEERKVRAFELAAVALSNIAKALTGRLQLEERRFQLDHPIRVRVRDVHQTRIHDEETERRRSQGDTGEESDSAWRTLGPREQEIKAASKAQRRASKARTKASRAKAG